MTRARLAWAVLIAALAGCTSTPQATGERDAEAKRFLARPGAAVIYVYRFDIGSTEMASDDTVLYVDERLIGSTVPLTFFRFEVQEGAHLLHGTGHDQGRLKLETRAGEIYFVQLLAAGGVSDFRRVDAETGKRDILRCCSLLENWAPGQRPLLR
jgi:hypothetical protein